jgi:hypothetical protein
MFHHDVINIFLPGVYWVLTARWQKKLRYRWHWWSYVAVWLAMLVMWVAMRPRRTLQGSQYLAMNMVANTEAFSATSRSDSGTKMDVVMWLFHSTRPSSGVLRELRVSVELGIARTADLTVWRVPPLRIRKPGPVPAIYSLQCILGAPRTVVPTENMINWEYGIDIPSLSWLNWHR